MILKIACLFIIVVATNSYNWGVQRRIIKSSNQVNKIICTRSKLVENLSFGKLYAVSKSKQYQPKNENKFLKVISKLWSATFGWLISGLVFFVRSILGKNVKSDTGDIDETIENIREIAEIENFAEVVEPVDDVISVTVANEFVEELTIPPKAMDKQQLAAARKIVERKLEELKKTTSPVASSNVVTTVSTIAAEPVQVVNLIPSEETVSLGTIDAVVTSPVASTVALTTTSEASTDGEQVATSQDIRNSFPEVLSEKLDDQTYMSYQFGSIDPYAVFGNDYSKSAEETVSVASVVDSAAKVQTEDTWGKIKAAGKSGLIAYTLTELSFWAIVPILVVAYESLHNGAALDLADKSQQVSSTSVDLTLFVPYFVLHAINYRCFNISCRVLVYLGDCIQPVCWISHIRSLGRPCAHRACLGSDPFRGGEYHSQVSFQN